MSNEIATRPARAPAPLSMMDAEVFSQMCRVGKMFAVSPLFPAHLRQGGIETATANGVLVLNMAQRLNEDPMTVAQNIYFVSGKPGWSAAYIIAKANQHGVFKGRIKTRTIEDHKGIKGNLAVTAYATLAEDDSEVSSTVDMQMAEAEGWTKNAKYKSMPEVMLVYRASTFLIRRTCPEVMLGIPPADEVEDVAYSTMRDVSPSDAAPEAPTPEPEPEAKPKKAAKPAAKQKPVVEEPAPEAEGSEDVVDGDDGDDGDDGAQEAGGGDGAEGETDMALEDIRDRIMQNLFDGMPLKKARIEFAADFRLLTAEAPEYLEQILATQDES